MRHHGVDIDRPHPLADRTLHTQQADSVLVFHQFADRTHAAIAEVVDVVDLTAPVLQVAQCLDGIEQVFLAQNPQRILGLHVQAHVHLHTTDSRQIVAVHVEEQATEQRFGRFLGRRLTGTHDAVDVDQRVVAVGVLIHRQRVTDPRPVGLIDRQGRQTGDTGILQRREAGFGQFLASFGVDFAGIHVHQIFGHVAAQ